MPSLRLNSSLIADRRLGEEEVKPPPIGGGETYRSPTADELLVPLCRAAAVIDIINKKKLDCVTRRRVA